MGKERALAGALAMVVLLGVARSAPRGAAAPAKVVGARTLTGGERRVLGLPLDLNSATGPELEGLPGVGPALASRILADRAAHGRYGQLEDLARVPGIGPGKLRLLAGRATVLPEQ